MSSLTDRVDEAASSLADQLTILYPDGPPILESEVQAILDVLADDNARICGFSADKLREIVALSVQRWKLNTPTKSAKTGDSNAKAKSFSLFDQLNGAFALPVSLEEIQQAPTTEERLQVISKVAHVEDLVADWTEIRAILNKLLQDTNTSLNHTFECVDLVRKWVDQCRSSVEYLSLQYDLCQLIMDAVVAKVDLAVANDGQADAMVYMLQTWRDAFLDLMTRGMYSSDGAAAMEVTMLLLLRPISLTHETNNSVAHQPGTIMALLDPQVQWFSMWTSCVSHFHIVRLLQETRVLSQIRTRCQIMSSAPTEKTVSERALHYQSIAMVASILSATRVCYFPWEDWDEPLSNQIASEQLRQSTPIPDEHQPSPSQPTQSQLTDILQLFLNVAMASKQTGYPTWLRSICVDAVETLIWGCKASDDATVFQHCLDVVATAVRDVCILQGDFSQEQTVRKMRLILEAVL